MRLTDYQWWAAGQVRDPDPAPLTNGWATNWGKTLSSMRETGCYEHAALILSRWEFLGGLYRGASETNAQDARAYADRFMLSSYKSLQSLSTRADVASDLFSMLRNGPLHGFTPAGVRIEGRDEVVAWRIGEAHLEFNGEGNLGIDSQRLQEDFIASVEAYVKYLAHDTILEGDPPKSPKERWRRGFWMRFCPIVKHSGRQAQLEEWFEEGIARGLFSRP